MEAVKSVSLGIGSGGTEFEELTCCPLLAKSPLPSLLLAKKVSDYLSCP